MKQKSDAVTWILSTTLAILFTYWFCTHLEKIELEQPRVISPYSSIDPNVGGNPDSLRTRTEIWMSELQTAIPKKMNYQQACDFEQDHIELFRKPEPSNPQTPYSLSGGSDTTFIPGPEESNVMYWNAVHVTLEGKRFKSDPYSAQIFVIYRNGDSKFISQSNAHWVPSKDGKYWDISFEGDTNYNSQQHLPINDPKTEKQIIDSIALKGNQQ